MRRNMQQTLDVAPNNGVSVRISVLSQRIPFPPNKGEKLRTYHQIKRLTELGHKVSVLSFAEEEKDHIHAKQLTAELDVSVELFPLGSKFFRYLRAFILGKPLSSGYFYNGNLAERISGELDGTGTDLLFLTASSLADYVKDKSDQAKCALMMDFMDVDSDKWTQYADNAKWPMSWVYRREASGIRKLECEINESFSECFLIAEEEVALFSRSVTQHKPVSVLGNGMDFTAFFPPEDKKVKEPAHFLFTGVMDYKPNVDAVLWFVKSCWPQIKLKLPNAKFTIGGMNPSPEIKALTKLDGINVTGFVDDMLPYFHQATVFVAPFRLARGVQNKVLQAVACGLPVVTTSAGAEGISFAGIDCMYIADEASEFLELCISAATSAVEAQEKSQKALICIRKDYGWEQQLKPLEEAISNL